MTEFYSLYVPYVTRVCYQDTCTRMFLGSLFIVANKWEQLKCLYTIKWVNYVVFVQSNIFTEIKKCEL